MRKILWVFLPIILLTVSAKSSYACMCTTSSTARKLLLMNGKVVKTDKPFVDDYPGVVFSGQVVKIKKVKVKLSTGDDWNNYRVTFKVDRYWKGTDSPEMVVFTGAGDGDCGIRFRKGERYIVFAEMLENKLRTGICTLTADSRYAERIISGLNLGEGMRPTVKQ